MNLIDRVKKTHRERGRRDSCGFIVWLEAQTPRLAGLAGEELTAAEDALRIDMAAHEGWTADWSVDGIITAAGYLEPEKSRVQTVWANDIIATHPATGVPIAARLLRHHASRIADEPRAALEAYVAAG